MSDALSTAVDQFNADVALASQIVNGDANTVVETAGGPVPSFAKLQADFLAVVNALGGNFLPSVQDAAAQAAASAAAAASMTPAVPYYVAADSIVTIPEESQAVSALPINLDGVLMVDGILIEA
jgi:hypothetical protein